MNQELQDRLSRLERRYARLEAAHRRRSYLGMALLGGLLMLGAARLQDGRSAPDLEVSSLTVVDGEGLRMAWVGVEERAGAIKLFDAEGEVIWTAPPRKPRSPKPPITGKEEPSVDVPQLHTAEQIRAMTQEEAENALKQVADARRHGRFDKATGERLKEEFRLLIQRIAELRGRK